MRLFVAITIEEKIKEEIFQFEEEIKDKTQAKVKWVPKENLHLTLKFLGEVKEKKSKEVIDELKVVAIGFPVFKLKFERTGGFPPGKHPRVIWVGAEGKEIFKLVEKIEKCMEVIGFLREKRDFKSHITIGRIKGGTFELDLIEQKKNTFFGEMEVKNIDLYQSHLSPQGPTYKIKESFYFSF